MIQGTQESFPSGYFFALSKTAVSSKEHFLTCVNPPFNRETHHNYPRAEFKLEKANPRTGARSTIQLQIKENCLRMECKEGIHRKMESDILWRRKSALEDVQKDVHFNLSLTKK